MKDVSHTSQMREVGEVFSRGPRAMTDGGRRRKKKETMKDVDHTPPSGDRDVNRVFERGHEHAQAEEEEEE